MGSDIKLDRMMYTKKRIRIAAIVTIIVVAALGVASYFVFRAQEIDYIGGNHYQPEELNQYIFGTSNPNILFYMLTQDKNKSIAFVQKYDVDVEWPNKLTVTIYEKPIVGYISYMGSNMYFDKDGTVVESSSAIYENVPRIEGLSFKTIVLNSKLEIDNMNVFSEILELTQAFDKYDLNIDKIYFGSAYEVTLYMNKVKIDLGSVKDCSERLFVLKQMQDSIKELEGTLYLSGYNGTNSSVTFKKEN